MNKKRNWNNNFQDYFVIYIRLYLVVKIFNLLNITLNGKLLPVESIDFLLPEVKYQNTVLAK